MFLEEQYNYYRLALDLAAEKEFDVLHIDTERSEIWLEQKIGKVSHLVRLAHHSYDWTNQLKRDTNILAQRVKSLRKILTGRKVMIHNVYIAKYPPVDDWEKLKEPMKIPDRKQLEMNLYYLDEKAFHEEKKRLYSNISKQAPDFIQPATEQELEQETDRISRKVDEIYRNQRKQAESLFSYGKPFFIYAILLINLFMFYLLELNGSSTSPSTLIEYGAKYNPAILEGEWWRIVTSMFLHVGFFHLLMNMIALYYLGIAVERIYGNGRFLFIYFLAGIFGGMTSFVFNSHVAAGASGALFGLFGALLYFGLMHRKLFFQTMGWNLLFIISLNIFIGVMIPQIDNGAHIGGLIGGFFASGVVSLPGNKKKKLWPAFAFFYLLGITILWFVGTSFFSQGYNEEVQIQLTQQFVQEERYQDAYNAADKGVNEDGSGDDQAELLFYRAYAAIHLEKTDQAIQDLEQVVELDAELPEAHYNLALLYEGEGKTEKALKQAETAYQLNPENEQFQSLYQRLADY